MAAKKKPAPKVVEATKPRPILRCEIETVHNVEYHEMDSFIEAVTGYSYECVANEEWSNDSQHRFSVDGQLSDYEQQEWDKFKKGESKQECFFLRTILEGLVKDGHLVPGIYIISVCW